MKSLVRTAQYSILELELRPTIDASQQNVGATYKGYARNPLQVQAIKTLPFTTSTVTIGRSGASDVVLSWQPVIGADFYRVWYHVQPYFTSERDPGPGE